MMFKAIVLMLFSLLAVSTYAATPQLDEHMKYKDCMLQIDQYCNINDDACITNHVIHCANQHNMQAPSQCDGRCLRICIASCRTYFYRCQNLNNLNCMTPHNECVHNCVINCHCSDV